MRPARRRRLFLFGGLAALLAAALLTVFVLRVRDRFRVDPWEGYLGDNERAALQRVALEGQREPVTDPLLAVPGLDVVYGQSLRNRQGDQTLFFVTRQPRAAAYDPLDLMAGFWSQTGLEVEAADGVIRAAAPDGRSYVASADPELSGQWVVVRRAAETSILASRRPSAWPAAMNGVFPPIPTDSEALELGEPGRPGYSVMIPLNGPADASFRVLDADLLRRGWEPLSTDFASAERPGGLDVYARMYRHKTHPLGCQLLIERDPERFGASLALMALL